MGLYEFIFGEKKKAFGDFLLEDLERERISAEQKLKKYEEEENDAIETERKLKMEYAFAAGPSQKRSLARKIQMLRSQGTNRAMMMTMLGKNLQTVSNIILIKERENFFAEAGILSALNGMNLGEITAAVNKVTSDGQLQSDKLDRLCETLGAGIEEIAEMSGDADLNDLMKELDAETEPIRREEIGRKIDEGFDQADKEIDRQNQKSVSE